MVGQPIACPVCANTITIPAPAPVADEVASLTSSPAGKDQSLLTSSPTKKDERADSAVRAPKRRLPVLALAAVFVVLALAAAAFVFLRGKGGGGLNVLAALTGPPPTEIHVFPTNINLTTKNDRQSVVVQALYADGLTRDVTADASFALANKSLAKIE